MQPVVTIGATRDVPIEAAVTEADHLLAPHKGVPSTGEGVPYTGEGVPSTGSVTPSEAVADAPAGARVRWSVRVMLTSLVAGLFGFGIGVMPMLWWHYQQNRAAERREAVALAGWLAADTTHALETSEQAANAAQGVLEVPGVSEALVLSSDGRVLAPASRAGEVVATLPGLHRAPSSIFSTYDTHVGPEVQVAQPVQANGDPRAAIVWLAFNPASVHDGPEVVLVSALLAACGLSLLVGWLAARGSQRAMAQLNNGLHAMLAGRLQTLADPIGAPSIRDLTMTLTHIVTRLRATAGGDLQRMRASASPSGAALAMPEVDAIVASTYAVAPSPASVDVVPTRLAPQAQPMKDGGASDESGLDVRAEDAFLVTNVELRIVRASPACERVLGTSPERLLGRHLLETIPTGALANAILRGLAELPPVGEAEMRATLGDGTALGVVIHRAASNAGVTLVLRTTASAPETPDTVRREGDVP